MGKIEREGPKLLPPGENQREGHEMLVCCHLVTACIAFY
jgi:hypothetical protein